MVIAIISLLVSILLPSLKKAKDLAREVVCLNNIKQLNTTFQLYRTEWDGCFPMAPRNDGDGNALPEYNYNEPGYDGDLWPKYIHNHYETRELYDCPFFDVPDGPHITRAVEFGYNNYIPQSVDDQGWNFGRSLPRPDQTILLGDSISPFNPLYGWFLVGVFPLGGGENFGQFRNNHPGYRHSLTFTDGHAETVQWEFPPTQEELNHPVHWRYWVRPNPDNPADDDWW